MDDPNYKYDVAFSFLAQDEGLATEINDLLQDRVRIFLYSKTQGEIAGTDGEKAFNAIFEEEARLVIVLYRIGWGQTPWTRIEETAIRNRAYEHGYDFVKFIPLDDPPTVPKWLPRTQLWVGLNRWGTSGAASVIEARVEELGGTPHEESVMERATRLKRSLDFSENRKQFLGSEKGVIAAKDEFKVLQKELVSLIAKVKESVASLPFTLKQVDRQSVVFSKSASLNVNWHYRYSNSLENAQLSISLWDGHPPYPGLIHSFDEPMMLQEIIFTFDLLPNDQCCWISSNSSCQCYTSKELASFALKFVMDQIDKLKDS